MSESSKIRRGTIDLSQASGYVDGEEDEIIRKFLSKEGLYGYDFLYTIFNFDRKGQVEGSGQYRNPRHDSIFAFTSEQLRWSGEGTNSLLVCADQYERPGLIVYDSKCFTKKYLAFSDWEYKFMDSQRKPESVRGIFEIVLAKAEMPRTRTKGMRN